MQEPTIEEVEAVRLAILDVMQLSSPTPLEMVRAAILAYNATPGQAKLRADARLWRASQAAVARAAETKP